MRVEQELHGMYSSKSFKCSSSSTARVIIPLQLPGTRGFRSEGRSPTSFATGCWFCIIMISSPGVSLPISSVSVACAFFNRHG